MMKLSASPNVILAQMEKNTIKTNNLCWCIGKKVQFLLQDNRKLYECFYRLHEAYYAIKGTHFANKLKPIGSLD